MHFDAKSSLHNVTSPLVRDLYLRSLEPRLAVVHRESLIATIAELRSPTVGDLLELLHEDLYLLEPNDPTTIGDLIGREGGPTIVQLLEDADLPLADPLSADPPGVFVATLLVDLLDGRADGVASR